MTSLSDPNPDLEASPGVTDTVKVLAAQIGAPDSATVKEQETEVRSQGGPLSGEVTVDWGGTERSVKIEDLVSAARQQEQTQQQAGAVDAKLAEMGQLQQFRAVLDELDPVQLQELRNLVADPAKLTALANGQPRQQDTESDLEAQVDRLVSNNPKPAPADAELQDLKRKVDLLVNHANSSLAQDRQTSLQDHVTAQMGQFPVFSEIAGSQDMSKDSIMNAIATAGPNANVDNIVADHAGKLHRLIQSSRKGVVETRTGGPPSPTATPVVPEGWKPKAADLLNRNILRAAQQRFREVTGES